MAPMAGLCGILLAATAAATTTAQTSQSRISPPDGAIVVSQDTSRNGTYSTVQAGIDALSTTATGEQFLFIYPGSYEEQVV